MEDEKNRESAVKEIEKRKEDIEKAFDSNNHELDFVRKLFLIENCIYGVDMAFHFVSGIPLQSFCEGKLNDPKGVSRDVSSIGHWGNGDYELQFENDEDLEYILSLVKQSLKLNKK